MSETRSQHGADVAAGRAEAETTLVIVADPPDPVADAVASLNELDAFPLLRAPDESIADRYFDTPDGVLGSAGTSLRLRELDTRLLLTIKGPTRAGIAGVPTRDEDEEPWPDRAWALLRRNLGGTLGIPAAPPASDAGKALEAVGLEVAQTRTTARRVRDVLPRTGGRARVAELAIDAVLFDLAGHAVRHYELELEAKAEGGEAAVAELTEILKARFGTGLRCWSLGKFWTGKEIAALIAELGPEAVLLPDGRVRPSAYDAIGGVG